MDPWSVVAEEVALEGLDGITIPTLWTRLGDRQPKFPLKLDDCTKELIWKSLVINSELKFYQLPKERGDVVLFDRFKNIDPETGIVIKQPDDNRKEIYPVHIILEHKDGIQGSCSVLQERIDVTKHVRSKSLTVLLSLQEALERYGRKLVVVASQPMRFRALIGSESDPDLKLNDHSFCVLERVGRARWQGELQSDLHGQSFKTDARKMHYMRKSLVKHGLVTTQSYVTRTKTGQQLHSVLLLLKSYHVNRRSKYDILMEQVSNFLERTPHQLAAFVGIKKHLQVKDSTFKRVYQYMKVAKLVEHVQIPLEEFEQGSKPCLNTKGKKILVRCLKLLKPYSQKDVPGDDDNDDDDEEDYSRTRQRDVPLEGRVMEHDVLTQAYDIILSCGTKGMPKSGVGDRMNVGKLEVRMLCRSLERDGLIKGFMVDEGRQRTTKYISHRFVDVSNQLHLFAKEQERKKLLFSAPQPSDSASKSKSSKRGNKKAKKNQKAGGGGEDATEATAQACGVEEVEMTNGGGGKAKGKSRAGRHSKRKKGKQTQPDVPEPQPTPAGSETPVSCESNTTAPAVVPTPEQAAATEEEQSEVTSVAACTQTESSDVKPPDFSIVVVKDICTKQAPSSNKSREAQETYRLLRRKNLIVEAVRSFKIVEGLFQLQKMITEEEKQDGIHSKCCKKTILRLIHTLSREGLLKFFTTTIIQDGISKKVDLIVHPSIQPNDDRVSRVIEQVRFKISSSYSAVRLQQEEEKAKELKKKTTMLGDIPQKEISKENKEFKPVPVRGLGKSLGFQPKMHRLRVVHNFLWYLIYGHPLIRSHANANQAGETSESTDISDTEAKPPENNGERDTEDTQNSSTEDEATQPPEVSASSASTADAAFSDIHSESDMKVYVDEESWKRFIPPVRVHKEYSSGWAFVRDLLLCLPLSIFIQIVQINYEVDKLEEYMNDPVKQHYLVRVLPPRMRRQLLYRRKYLFVFHENLERLVYMGLLQLGPVEKFKEKDQVFIYLKRNATIVDTTCAEPHYWLVSESPDKPFEKRRYTFNTAEDVENYWFDLMCVCLNTPLGVIRTKRSGPDEETQPSFMRDRSVFVGLAYLLKGTTKVCDDGTIPGDGKGAGGLDSEFFGHLKRNWFWTNRLLAVRERQSALEARENSVRLKSLLSNNALRFAFKAGATTNARYMTNKLPLLAENIEMRIEPASRNQQVIGGKKQKRKRNKKEPKVIPRKKKKEPKKRTPAHDETDHRALKMMTRQRVYWSIQEDSLLMLCSAACQLLNSKLKRPFIAHCVVRDLLHSEFDMSADKTSLAVGRRTRYILKNPQTLLNYRICIAEVYQDKELMTLLENSKPTQPDDPEDCAKSLREYIKLFRQKFSTILGPGDISIPDTKEELYSRFRVCAIDAATRVMGKDILRNTDDIHITVLQNLIQSTLAMTNSQMKSSRSFQTFHMYSKYNQELLCQVFVQCRKNSLVNRRRVNQPFGPKKNRALPILPMSYQLSQSYYRCFTWRIPHSLCTDSFRFQRNLMGNGARDDRTVNVLYLERENRLVNGEPPSEQQKGSRTKEKQSGLVDGGPAASEPDLKPAEGVEPQPKEENKPPAASAEDPRSKERTVDQLPGQTPASDAAAADPEEPPDVSDMMLFPLDSPGGACALSLSLMSVGLLNVFLSIPKQMVVVDSTLVDNDIVKSLEEDDDDDVDDAEENEGGKKLEVKAQNASHTKYLMMRGYCCPGIVSIRNLNTNDNIVVESCIMRLQLRSTPAHNIFPVEHSPPLDLSKCGPSLVPSNLTFSVSLPSSSSSSSSSSYSHGAEECDKSLVEQRGYSPPDMEACAQLRRSLDEAGHKGLDVHDLFQAHAHQVEPQSGRTRSLQQYIQDLQDEGLVLKVGARGVRYVLLQHAEPWLLTVNSKQWGQSRFISDKRQFLNNPYLLKRTRRGRQQEIEEPPPKRAALENEESRDGEEEEGRGVTRDNLTEEMPSQDPTARADEGSGGKEVSVEAEAEAEAGGEQVENEEAGEKSGEEMMETEEKREGSRKRRSRQRDSDDERVEEAAGSSDVEENLSFISRPWRMVDGKLNQLVCKGMLEGVLYHVMSQPGITQETLVKHYKRVLQPMAVLDLVQALLDLGCIVKKTLVKSRKPSLFSRPVTPVTPETRSPVEEPDCVYYEPTINCCLRLSQVLPNERHWNTCIP